MQFRCEPWTFSLQHLILKMKVFWEIQPSLLESLPFKIPLVFLYETRMWLLSSEEKSICTCSEVLLHPFFSCSKPELWHRTRTASPITVLFKILFSLPISSMCHCYKNSFEHTVQDKATVKMHCWHNSSFLKRRAHFVFLFLVLLLSFLFSFCAALFYFISICLFCLKTVPSSGKIWVNWWLILLQIRHIIKESSILLHSLQWRTQFLFCPLLVKNRNDGHRQLS